MPPQVFASAHVIQPEIRRKGDGVFCEGPCSHKATLVRMLGAVCMEGGRFKYQEDPRRRNNFF